MKHIKYTPQGVCSVNIEFDLDDNIIKNLRFTGGCNGNLQAVSALCEGKSASETISVVSGISCGMKNSSCHDQLARAIAQATQDN